MQSNYRKYLIAGNWKMNTTSVEDVELVKGIHLAVGEQTEVSVVVFPPFTALQDVAHILDKSIIQLGAQNMHFESAGAYTGEISVEMLRNLFCDFVILGHSERRTHFGERDEFINKKVHAALNGNLHPILCVGESLDERIEGRTQKVIEKQVKKGLAGLKTHKEVSRLVIAYEPVWAIGTGRTATPQIAQEVHSHIRQLVAEILGKTKAGKIRILYGGSMTPDNAPDLLEQPDIDGGLIGGASLKAHSFSRIVEMARRQASI